MLPPIGVKSNAVTIANTMPPLIIIGLLVTNIKAIRKEKEDLLKSLRI